MKKFLSALLITLFAFTSCKKEDYDEILLNTTSFELIQKTIVKGYWQLDYYYNVETLEKFEEDAFLVLNFGNNNEFNIYTSKTEDPDKSFYRLESVDDVAVLKLYDNETRFEENEESEKYVLKIENGMLIFSDGGVEITFKKYSTLADTKEFVEVEELD